MLYDKTDKWFDLANWPAEHGQAYLFTRALEMIYQLTK